MIFFIEFIYSHLRGPAKLNNQEGEASTRQDSGAFGVVIPARAGMAISLKLGHEAASYYGDVYLKSRHLFQRSFASVALKKRSQAGTFGLALESPFSQKSQEGSEILYYQRSAWLQLFYWKSVGKKSRVLASLTAEPNGTLSGQNNSWKNALQLLGAVRHKISGEISIELALMRRTPRYQSLDQGHRGEKIAANRFTLNVSRTLSGRGQAGIFFQVLGGDGRGRDQQGEFFQASQLTELLGISTSFSL